jgi:cytochrome c
MLRCSALSLETLLPMRLLLPLLTRLMLCTLATLAPGAHAAADAARIEAGRKAFAPCAGCHHLGPSASNGFGPQLNGLFGRPAGTVPGYTYSPAMKNARIVWSDATVSAFVADPSGVVPGTKMRFWSLGYDERKLADLMAYLHTFSAEP